MNLIFIVDDNDVPLLSTKDALFGGAGGKI